MNIFNDIPAYDLFSPRVRKQNNFSFFFLSPLPYWFCQRWPLLILDKRFEHIAFLSLVVMEILNSSVLPKSVPDPVDEVVEGIHLKCCIVGNGVCEV